MEKKKISELIKELNIEVKELSSVLKEGGFPAKNSKSSVDQAELDYLLAYFTMKNSVESIESLLEAANEKKPEPVKEEKEAEKKPAPSKEKKEIKKEEKKQEPKKELNDDEELKRVIEAPIQRKVRHIDTRSSNIEEKKIDDEKI